MGSPPALLKSQRSQRDFAVNFLLSPARKQRDVNKGRKLKKPSPSGNSETCNLHSFMPKKLVAFEANWSLYLPAFLSAVFLEDHRQI
jgi:hypothetical protein